MLFRLDSDSDPYKQAVEKQLKYAFRILNCLSRGPIFPAIKSLRADQVQQVYMSVLVKQYPALRSVAMLRTDTRTL